MIITKISEFIAGHPKTILIVTTLLLIPAIIGYLGTFVNYDIMSYLPEDIESVQAEEILDKEFESAANAFLVVENMKPKEIVALKDKIANVKGVNSVIWVDDFLDISIPQSVYPDAVTDIFYSSDDSATLIMIQFAEGSASTVTMDAIKEIKGMLNKQCFLSGMSAIIEDTKELSDSEAPKYIAVAIVLALIALSLTMDSWVLPLVLLVSLGYAIIYNMGTNFFMPGGISYITQSIAAILQLGVTMDYSVFLMDRFNEEQQLTDNRTKAMANAIASTFISLAGSSLTTVFGFLALCFMSLTLGFDIGIVMAKGVLLGVLTVVVVLPSYMLLFYKPIYRFRHKRVIPSFDKLNTFIVKHSRAFAIAFLCLIIPSFAAKSAVPLDYNISNAMPEQLASVRALVKLKGDFNMAMTHFVIIDDSVPSGKVSEMITEFEKTDGVSNVISLNSFVGPAISEKILPDTVKDICFKNGRQLMMVNSVYNTASDEANEQIEKLTSIVKKYDKNGYITGEGVMSKDLIAVTDKDFKITSIISIAAIFVLIAICFKSCTVPVFLVSAIELAIFLNMAVALVTGADVSFVAPTVISCVQLGATVDYAILMTTRFREELQTGKNKKDAILAAANASDKSIFQSALVFFCATFGVFVTCNIDIVRSICSMLARGAVVSGLVIIIFLPALLVSFEGIINRTTIGWRRAAEKKEKKSKKTEGDRMKSSSVIRKCAAGAMVLAMVISMTACGKTAETEDAEQAAPVSQPVYTASPSEVSKTETVYVNINNDGSVDNVSVTDWLHTDRGEVCVNDVSNLTDIESIKDDTVPVISGSSVQWNMSGTDLYYSGRTDKNPPVSLDINYYLDGKKISPDDLIGKSGDVKIEVKMTNNLYKKVEIDGKTHKVYLPVLVAGGFILPESDFSDVQVSSGRSVGDGTKEIAVMFGFPGLSESLGISELGISDIEGLELGNTVSVTAKAENFELGNMYFAAVPISSLNIEIGDKDTVEDLKSTLAILRQVQNTLSGMDVGALISMFTSDAGSTDSLVNVVSDAAGLYSSNAALIRMLTKYVDPANNEAVASVLEFLTSENTESAVKILSSPVVIKFFSDLSKLGDAFPLTGQFFSDLQDPEVQLAISNLPDTLSKLAEIQGALTTNTESIQYLLSLLDGDTVNDISDILSMLGGADLDSFEEKYSSLVANSDVIVAKAEKWIEFGKEYRIFSDAPDEMTTTLLFVYMTPSLEKAPAAEENNTQSNSGESPLDSFIKKFR